MKKRKVFLGIIIVLIVVGIAGTVYAADPNLISKGQSFIANGKGGTLDSNTMWSALKPVAQLLMIGAVTVFVGVGFVMGVKFMFQGPDQKARMKERLIWYVISMVFVFGVVGIFNILVAVFDKILT